jgi:hypothetical protein
MTRLAKLQLIGPIVLAMTIIAAELAAYLLALKPSSVAIWYLNIEVFGIFQRSHYVLSDQYGVPYLQLLFVALPLLVLAAIGFASRQQLLIALNSHFSFVYACFVTYTWYLVGAPSQPAASLAQSPYTTMLSLSTLDLSAKPQVVVMVALLAAAAISFASSHIHYFHAIRQS